MARSSSSPPLFPPTELALLLQGEGNTRIFSHIRGTWLVHKPEERVRQEYVCVLVNEYGYHLDQMAEEMSMTGRGSAQARADIVVWRSVDDKRVGRPPLIVVECKSDNVTIRPDDYQQGDHYARIANAPFVVTHNSRETRYWRVVKERVPGWLQEIENIPKAGATDAAIEAVRQRLKTFREDEFANLLHKCHNIIRNRDHLDPAAAFDEIAKILFMKVTFERRLKRTAENVFSARFIEEQGRILDDPIDRLFEQTKREFRDDDIFDREESINLKPATVLEIVRELEAYNLSDTSEDIKGIAFERFLGRTFRGEIGQFFTPRPIVEFMIRMVDPREGDTVCDPASGSGGFLIRFFEIVRELIHQRVDAAYRGVEQSVTGLSDEDRAAALRKADEDRRHEVDQTREGSAVWALANRRIYGCDANERMARTSKMNMIMHGDGHGGVHQHNGFINVNGIFEGRFDVVLTNPPFGANVEASDKIEARLLDDDDDRVKRYRRTYGEAYDAAQRRVRNAIREPIASLFALPKGETGTGKVGRIKTELLFIERCIDLLKPGGRLGIVLPEGVFNNPSLAYVRAFVEDRAYLRAVVSLPQDTFMSSGASVKASLLFLQRFTEEEAAGFEATRKEAIAEVDATYADEEKATTGEWEAKIEQANRAVRSAPDRAQASAARAERKSAESGLSAWRKEFAARKATEARALLKQRFDYPIFLYDAERVGITATGEEDDNELYPNPRVPSGLEKTALEHYRDFLDHIGEPDFFA